MKKYIYKKCKNKTNDHKETACGETKNLADWARDIRCNVHYMSITRRLKLGWSPEEAISKRKFE